MEFSSYLECCDRLRSIVDWPGVRSKLSVDRVPLDTMSTKSEEPKKQGWFKKKRSEVVYRLKKWKSEDDTIEETEDDIEKVSL